MPTQFYWHVHHNVLCEPLRGPIENRIAYVRANKPENEVETRLRLMKPVRGKLPKAYVEAWKAFEEARRVCEEALRVCKEAWKAYEEAEKAYVEASRALEEAEKTQEMKTLHDAECPNCPWNGETTFP